MIIKLAGYFLASIRLFAIVLLMILLVPTGIFLIYLRLIPRRSGFVIRNIFCKLALIIFGIKLVQTGKLENIKGALYVGNHRSLIDPIIIFSQLKEAYVISKADVESYPLIGIGAKMSGVIFVARENAESRKNTKLEIDKAMTQQKSIVIFPEGTISTNRKTLAFKKGSFEIAALHNRPVIAFAHEMANPVSDFWYQSNIIIQFYRTFSKLRTVVFLHFFSPIYNNDPLWLTSECEYRINQKLTEFQTNWNESEKQYVISVEKKERLS